MNKSLSLITYIAVCAVATTLRRIKGRMNQRCEQLETLKMMTQIRIVLVAMLLATGASGQQPANGGSSSSDTIYARPGQLVDAGGFRLNLYCMGSGSPTVVFDSGWGDWAPAWSKVQPQIAKWTCACSYDRAGTGFSDPGPMPRTSVRIAEELRTALLHNAGITGPYISGGIRLWR